MDLCIVEDDLLLCSVDVRFWCWPRELVDKNNQPPVVFSNYALGSSKVYPAECVSDIDSDTFDLSFLIFFHVLQVADNYYRPDLKQAALARLSVVSRSLQVANSGVKKRNRQSSKVHGRK